MPAPNPFVTDAISSSRRSRSLMRMCGKLLHQHRGRFARWIEADLQPPIIGCGNWGCVTMIDGGTELLKLTVDPAEPLLALLIGELQREDSARGEMVRAGVVKIRKVARLRGQRWRYRGEHPVYAIVREAVIPVEDEISQSRSDPLSTWLRKRRRRASDRSKLEDQLQQRMDTIYLGGETTYRPPGWVSERTKVLLDEIVETLEAAEKRKTPRARARQEAAAVAMMAELSSYPEGETLGEAMISLIAGFNVPLRDVHMGNIGLRTEQTFEGVPTPALVLFDFGHEDLRRIPKRRVPELRL